MEKGLFLTEAKSIAIVRTDKLGDMVLTLPMIPALKKINPKSQISVIASSYCEPLLSGQELIHQTHYVDKTEGGIKRIFKDNRFDAVFFPRPKFDEILAANRAGIKLRIGSGYRWYSFLLNNQVFVHRKYAEKSEAQYNVDLISSVAGIALEAKALAPKYDEAEFLELKERLGISEKFIIIHPGGGGSAPRWSAENFGELAKKVESLNQFQIFISGSKYEKDKCAIVKSYSPNAIDISGDVNLRQMIGLCKNTQALVSNSTGVLHIAASFDSPILGFYPNTLSMSAKRWGPLTAKSIILNPPKSKDPKLNDNLDLISAELAFSSFVQLLSI
jgi:ADP-heptose:LPS heptosyltransferase